MKKSTVCIHTGTIYDEKTGGVNSPIYPSSAFRYRDLDSVVYPRYFNTENQLSLATKIASLENAESGLLFSSGMAAIFTTMLSVLKAGDHIILQRDLYGGTHHLVTQELPNHGIEFTLVEASSISNFEKAIQKNTKAVYIETPSNPLLHITDIKAVADFAKAYKLVSMIDNTFASPINQNPIDFGIDIVLHSGTKYLGGHSDLCFGVMVSSIEWVEKTHKKSTVYGGSLNAMTCYLIERSLKTLAVRVKQQNENALALAQFLAQQPMIQQVYYPGLTSHKGYDIAQRQMHGFGGMLSFELRINHLTEVDLFLDELNLIHPAVSLGGVESLICSPRLTSHAKVSPEKREEMGIKDELLRFSVGIEAVEDLKQDLLQAIHKVETHSFLA